MIDSYIDAFRRYFDFKGRSTRTEYWYFSLLTILIMLILSGVDVVLGLYHPVLGLGSLGAIFLIFIIIPSTSISVRRLHDIGKNSWWLLISFIPFLGLFIIFWFALKPSDLCENLYGKSINLKHRR